MAVVASISQQIWDMKYRLRGPSGEPLDKTIEDTWRRVATALAAPERDPALWTQRFYAAMTDFKFLPAGRVVAGAGSGRLVTLFNCFAMGAILRGCGMEGAAGARIVGQDHAGDLRLCRARRDLHRPHQPPQQPLVLRADQRNKPLRRAAIAALRRLPLGLDQLGEPRRKPVHSRG